MTKNTLHVEQLLQLKCDALKQKNPRTGEGL